MSQCVFTSRIKNVDRGFADHPCNVLVINRIDWFTTPPYSHPAERQRLLSLNNSVDVTPAFAGHRLGRDSGVDLHVHVITTSRFHFLKLTGNFSRPLSPPFYHLGAH